MLKIMRSVYVSQNIISNKSVRGILNNVISKENYSRVYTNEGTSEGSNPKIKYDKSVTKTQRKAISPKITLISNDLRPTVMTLEEAIKLSKRRDLKLVKVMNIDQKTQRPVYKLMTGAEYFQEDLIHRKEKSLKKNTKTKEAKLLTLSANISDHDLESKIKNMIKWLNKRHEIRIVLNTGGNDDTAENICNRIETETKHASRMVQKRKTGDALKFQLLTLKKSQDDSNEQIVEESESTEAKKHEET